MCLMVFKRNNNVNIISVISINFARLYIVLSGLVFTKDRIRRQKLGIEIGIQK